MKKVSTFYKELNSPGRNDSKVFLIKYFSIIFLKIESKREMEKIPHHNDRF